MNHLEMIRLTEEDVPELQQISRESFRESFSKGNDAKNMQQYLDCAFAIDKLSEEISNPESEFYFVKLNNDVLGYLKINLGKAQTELKDNEALEIERIYVLGKFQRQNTGTLLMNKAIERARASGKKYIWLGVWENNEKAVNFYKKNGFVKFGDHSFWLGDDEQTDILMKLVLD